MLRVTSVIDLKKNRNKNNKSNSTFKIYSTQRLLINRTKVFYSFKTIVE